MSPSPSPWLLRAAAIFGFLGVSLGAFGAHGLAPLLQQHGTTAIWQTAVQYHFYHTLALLALALFTGEALRWRRHIATAWGLGILIFAGSLYTLALTGIKWLGAVTPIGGVLFLLGWVLLAFSYRRS